MDSPFYSVPLANKVFENSPKDINYSGIIVVPLTPQKISNLNYVKHEINIFGYLQFSKFILMYFKTKIKNFFNNKIKSLNQIAKEKEIFRAQAENSGKPEAIIEKMIEGRINKFLSEVSLLGQPFVKDPSTKIKTLLEVAHVSVEGFVRIEVGEGLEKKTEDFAAEVMAAQSQQ